MNGHAPRRQRLLVLLAGFFGLAVTSTLSIVPGTGVAEVIRAGAAAAANSAGNREPAAKAALNRDRRTAATWNRLTSVDAAYLWYRHAQWTSTHDTHASTVHGQVAVLHLDAVTPGAAVQRTGVTPERSVVPRSVHLAVALGRGPPSSTGS
ncbi:hypothetical protein [Actinomadura roseirufa]|uniref:hypothetical protein n=1 Tax=Actinomadura roseirufa TaxID=2094049 RepID=UPI001040F56E|nr:hypothetical protein [Actinomadura roseirufa]